MAKKRKKNRKPLIISLLILGLVVLFALFFYGVRTKKLRINRFLLPKDAVTGVDISRYQGDVDMAVLKDQGVQFIYIKATEGVGHTDERFAENWAKAREAALPRGAYHFFSLESPGEDQARHFIEIVGELAPDDLVPVIDVEYYGDKDVNPPSVTHVERELSRFIEIINETYGVTPVIYASGPLYDTFIKDGFGDHPRWVRSVYYPASVENGDDWVIWQYSDRGILEGYSGEETYIDLDVLHEGLAVSDLFVGNR